MFQKLSIRNFGFKSFKNLILPRVYAKLESVSIDTWIVASEKGVSNDVTWEPTGLGDACF